VAVSFDGCLVSISTSATCALAEHLYFVGIDCFKGLFADLHVIQSQDNLTLIFNAKKKNKDSSGCKM